MAVDIEFPAPPVPGGETLVERLSRLSRESTLMTLDALVRIAPRDGSGAALAACQAKRLADSLAGGLTGTARRGAVPPAA